jgi:hypothetical protein
MSLGSSFILWFRKNEFLTDASHLVLVQVAHASCVVVTDLKLCNVNLTHFAKVSWDVLYKFIHGCRRTTSYTRVRVLPCFSQCLCERECWSLEPLAFVILYGRGWIRFLGRSSSWIVFNSSLRLGCAFIIDYLNLIKNWSCTCRRTCMRGPLFTCLACSVSTCLAATCFYSSYCRVYLVYFELHVVVAVYVMF